jgi:hypothetical protein
MEVPLVGSRVIADAQSVPHSRNLAPPAYSDDKSLSRLNFLPRQVMRALRPGAVCLQCAYNFAREMRGRSNFFDLIGGERGTRTLDLGIMSPEHQRNSQVFKP